MIIFENETYLIFRYEKKIQNKKNKDNDELSYFEFFVCKKTDHPKKREKFLSLEKALNYANLTLKNEQAWII